MVHSFPYCTGRWGGRGLPLQCIWYCISQLYSGSAKQDNGRIEDGGGELTLIGTVFLNFISELYFVFHSTMYDVRCAMCDVQCAMCETRQLTMVGSRMVEGS